MDAEARAAHVRRTAYTLMTVAAVAAIIALLWLVSYVRNAALICSSAAGSSIVVKSPGSRPSASA